MQVSCDYNFFFAFLLPRGIDQSTHGIGLLALLHVVLHSPLVHRCPSRQPVRLVARGNGVLQNGFETIVTNSRIEPILAMISSLLMS